MKRKNNVIVVLSIVLMLSFLAGILSVLTAGFENWDYSSWLDRFTPDTQEIRINEDDQILSASVSNSENVRLFYGSGFGDDFLWKTVDCVVLPVDAVDKTVTWSLSWGYNGTGFEHAQTSNYLTLEVIDVDTVKVKCYQGFEGSTIVLTCTTNSGGFTAYCTFSYVGPPTTIIFTLESTNYENMSTQAVLYTGEIYDIDLNLNNKLGAVGSSYVPNWEIYDYSFSGRFVGTKHWHDNYPFESEPEDTYTDYIIDLSDNSTGSYDTYFIGKSFANIDVSNPFFSASIENGNLKINADKNEVTWSAIYGGQPGYYEHYYKEPYYPAGGGGAVSDIFFVIYVRDTVSGLTGGFRFDIENEVQSMALSDSSYGF